jgi:hypothetical protein
MLGFELACKTETVLPLCSALQPELTSPLLEAQHLLCRPFAFDHDGDGVLSSAPGLPRETGTFLKTIALLPYVRSLGCNVLHLLPIASIGQDGRKGALGSPYAMRDPYDLDETLSRARELAREVAGKT